MTHCWFYNVLEFKVNDQGTSVRNEEEVSTLDGGLTINGHWGELQQSAGNDTDYLATDRSNERNLLEIQEYSECCRRSTINWCRCYLFELL